MFIKSTDQLKTYLGGTVQKNISFASLSAFMEHAERVYLVPAIGEDLYQYLDEKPAADLTEKEAELLKLLGRSVSFYCLLEAMPFLNMQIGDAGIHEASLDNFGPVRQWTYNKAEDSAAAKADLFLDLALEYLERNGEDFPTWKNSEAYTISKELFISGTGELNRYLNIGNSRRAYLAFRPYLRRAEDIYIRPELCEELYEELQAVRLGPEPLTEDHKKLLTAIWPAVSHLAMVEAVPELSLSVSAGGFKVLNFNDGIRQRQAATDTQLTSLKANSQRLATIYMTALKNHLDTILQTGETSPDDNQQSFNAPDNTDLPAFWV